jgi:hypothetical protein
MGHRGGLQCGDLLAEYFLVNSSELFETFERHLVASGWHTHGVYFPRKPLIDPGFCHGATFSESRSGRHSLIAV